MADNENPQTLHTTTVQYKRKRNYLTTTNVNSSSSTPLAHLPFSQNYAATFSFSALPKGLKARSVWCPDFQPFPWKPQPKKALYLAERLNRARCDPGLKGMHGCICVGWLVHIIHGHYVHAKPRWKFLGGGGHVPPPPPTCLIRATHLPSQYVKLWHSYYSQTSLIRSSYIWIPPSRRKYLGTDLQHT